MWGAGVTTVFPMLGSVKTGCAAKKGLSSRMFLVGVFLLLDLVGFLKKEERNLVTEGPPPECSTRKPFLGYTSGFTLLILGARKRHLNNFSVTPVTDPPGRVPDPPGRVPGRKCLCSLGSAHST